MAFTTNPYCTLAQVKEFLSLSTTADDTFISDIIVQAQGDIDSHLGYSFQTDGTLQVPASRSYSGSDRSTMRIDRCASISKVTEAPYVVSIGSFDNLTVTQGVPLDITLDVFLGPNVTNRGYGFLLSRYSQFNFYKGLNNYTVQGIFGMPNIPTPIMRACILLSIHYYKLRDAGYSQTTATTGPHNSPMRYQRAWPDDVRQLVERYRSPLAFSTGV